MYNLTCLRQDGILTRTFIQSKMFKFSTIFAVLIKQKSGVITRLEADETSKQIVPTCIQQESKPRAESRNQSNRYAVQQDTQSDFNE